MVVEHLDPRGDALAEAFEVEGQRVALPAVGGDRRSRNHRGELTNPVGKALTRFRAAKLMRNVDRDWLAHGGSTRQPPVCRIGLGSVPNTGDGHDGAEFAAGRATVFSTMAP